MMGAHEVITAADSEQTFFAPTNFDAIDLLLGEYKRERQNIELVAEFMSGDAMSNAVRYFFDGNRERFNRYSPDPAEIFGAETAMPALNAWYWSRALKLTDVRDFMPDKRRTEWDKSITEMKTPDFEEETVRATLNDLLAQRMDFLAEMIDGIFRGLSGEHVTNRPEGFGKRMIIDYVYNEFGHAASKSGLIHDLRSVIAKFMGRDQPPYGSSRRDLEHFRFSTGVWHAWDGGALRIRVYKKGTAHLEVHPQIAYRLNQILAHLYPMAIPSQHRTKPKRKLKDFDLIQRPIPFATLKYIGDARFNKKGDYIRRATYNQTELRYDNHTLSMGYNDWPKADKHIKREVEKVIEAIGGVPGDRTEFLFDYNAKEVIRDMLASGCVPDHKSHQYYPTLERVAAQAVALAEIGESHSCLEPEAGQGGIADLMPKERTRCIEVSELHCKILQAKGYDALQMDFLVWAAKTCDRFDRIVMNPPFSEGRAVAHVEAAATLLKSDGRLVAVLPASYRGKPILANMKVSWSEVYENEFYGTSVSVVIMVAVR